MVAVARLPWTSWCVLGAAGFRFFFFLFFFFECTRPAARMRQPCLTFPSTRNQAIFPLWQTATLHTGKRTGCYYLISLFVCVSVTFVFFFSDCESWTSSISTNPGFIEAGEYGLTRGTRFIARRLEMVAVARLPWTSWCVLSAAGFRLFLFLFFFFECTRLAASIRPPCTIYFSTSNEVIFPLGQLASSYREAYRVLLFI